MHSPVVGDYLSTLYSTVHMRVQGTAAKEAEQARHMTHPTLAMALIVGTSGSEMLLLISFLLAVFTNLN